MDRQWGQRHDRQRQEPPDSCTSGCCSATARRRRAGAQREGDVNATAMTPTEQARLDHACSPGSRLFDFHIIWPQPFSDDDRSACFMASGDGGGDATHSGAGLFLRAIARFGDIARSIGNRGRERDSACGAPRDLRQRSACRVPGTTTWLSRAVTSAISCIGIGRHQSATGQRAQALA